MKGKALPNLLLAARTARSSGAARPASESPTPATVAKRFVFGQLVWCQDLCNARIKGRPVRRQLAGEGADLGGCRLNSGAVIISFGSVQSLVRGSHTGKQRGPGTRLDITS